jgi:GntR family carbon starvation induced transcriptional regulator
MRNDGPREQILVREERPGLGSPVVEQLPSSSAPEARVDWVANRLRDHILRGLLVSGEKIYPVKIAREWNVSPTPLREAIQRLASEGLLDVTPQRGARVALLSAKQAEEFYELRILLEPIAIRQSMENFTDADREAVAASFETYRRAWEGAREITYAMYQSHMAFHDATLARCLSTQLLALVSSLTVHCMRYTTWLSGRDRLKDHFDIADAVARDDVQEGMASVVRHSMPGLEWARAELAKSGPKEPTLLRPELLRAATETIIHSTRKDS